MIQWLFLFSTSMMQILIFTSYDALTVSDTESSATTTHPPSTTHSDTLAHKQASIDQIFPLAFVLIFFLFSRQHQLLFYPSMVQVLLAFLMMAKPALFFVGDRFLGSLFEKILFVFNALLNAIFAHEEEQSNRTRFRAKHFQNITQTRTENILKTLMPPLVVEELRLIGPDEDNPSHKYRHATIAQSDLCGFTKLASSRSPQEVVNFMADLFGMFDDLTDEFEVYKVETIGDAYIAGMADQPLTRKNSPINVILFGLGMIKKVHEWARRMGVVVTCRVGIHHGECIGGIVGSDMQRYHLFGDLMTVLEVLESTAPESKVQISVACKEEVERQMREDEIAMDDEIAGFLQRPEENLMTSKGDVHEFSEVGGKTFVVQVPEIYISPSTQRQTALMPGPRFTHAHHPPPHWDGLVSMTVSE